MRAVTSIRLYNHFKQLPIYFYIIGHTNMNIQNNLDFERQERAKTSLAMKIIIEMIQICDFEPHEIGEN